MNNIKKISITILIIMICGISFFIIKNIYSKFEKYTPIEESYIPYVSKFKSDRIVYSLDTNEMPYTYLPKNAKEAWESQENNFLLAEDRYSNEELASMLIENKYKAEQIIKKDKYDKKEIEKIKKEIEKERKNKDNQLNKSGKIEIITPFPHETFKSYMAWTTLSPKYAQGQLSAKASPDPETAIMKYDGRYLVALGFAYADYIGQKIDVVMENGSTIPIMVGDFKAIEHTDENQSSTLHDGSIIEFIVSSNKEAAEIVKNTGNYNTIFPGKVKEFRKIKEV